MKICPKCGYTPRKEISYSQFPLAERVPKVLMYMFKHGKPLFGAPLKRGETHNDDEMIFMLKNELIKQIGTEGFIVTDKGKSYANIG